MTKYRQMSLEGRDKGLWETFTSDEFDRSSHGSAAANWEKLIGRADVTVEIRRNGGWRPASVWSLPSWERAARLEISRLAQGIGQLTAKPSMRLSTAQGRLQGARSQLTTAQDAVKDAEGELKTVEDDMQAATKAAKKVEERVKVAEGEMERRHKLEDAREAVTVS